MIVIIIVLGFVLGRKILPEKEKFKTEKVLTTTITEKVSETGNIITSGLTKVVSPANGIVEEIYVRNGDIVEVDQELFKVISTATVQEQSAALANYLTAKNTLDAANSKLYTLRSDMFDKWKQFRDLATNSTYEEDDGAPKSDQRSAVEFHTSQNDWLSAEAKVNDQQAVISQGQASVGSTWLLYQATQDAMVASTANGTIANLSVSINDSVTASTTLVSAAAVLNVVDFSTNEIKVGLSETDILKVKPNQDVEIDPDAISDRDYVGKVIRVDDIGTNEGGVITYNVYIQILDADSRLKSGMTVDIDITTNIIKDVLSVPNNSVKPFQGGRSVQIIGKGGKAESIPVKIGTRGESRTQILEGLEEGQEIIVPDSSTKKDRPGFLF